MPKHKINRELRLSIIDIRENTKVSNAEIGRLFGISAGHVRHLLRLAGVPPQVKHASETMEYRQNVRMAKMWAINMAVSQMSQPDGNAVLAG